MMYDAQSPDDQKSQQSVNNQNAYISNRKVMLLIKDCFLFVLNQLVNSPRYYKQIGM